MILIPRKPRLKLSPLGSHLLLLMNLMDAELERISLNNYVAKIFSNHIQWERYERKVGLLPMTEAFLSEVLSQLTEEQIVNLAQRLEKNKSSQIYLRS